MTLGHLSRPARHRVAPICLPHAQPAFSNTNCRRIRPSVSSTETQALLRCRHRPPFKPQILPALGLHFP
jgi:hypothetical protein